MKKLAYSSVVVVVGLLLAICCLDPGKAHIQFTCLKAWRRDTAKARAVSEGLAMRPAGVRLALADMDVFGGTTRGWSSWILKHADDGEFAEKGLWGIADSRSQRASRRIEALWILWERTGDKKALVRIFDLVKQPGGAAVSLGRERLGRLFQEQVISQTISVPASQPIGMGEEQFERMLSALPQTAGERYAPPCIARLSCDSRRAANKPPSPRTIAREIGFSLPEGALNLRYFERTMFTLTWVVSADLPPGTVGSVFEKTSALPRLEALTHDEKVCDYMQSVGRTVPWWDMVDSPDVVYGHSEGRRTRGGKQYDYWIDIALTRMHGNMSRLYVVYIEEPTCGAGFQP